MSGAGRRVVSGGGQSGNSGSISAKFGQAQTRHDQQRTGGGGGQRTINIQKPRSEAIGRSSRGGHGGGRGGKQGGHDGGRGRGRGGRGGRGGHRGGGRGGRGGRGGGRGGKPMTKEDLDKDLDSYLFKDEKTAKEALDAQLDDYFSKPDEKPAEEAPANGTASTAN